MVKELFIIDKSDDKIIFCDIKSLQACIELLNKDENFILIDMITKKAAYMVCSHIKGLVDNGSVLLLSKGDKK